MKRVKRSLHIGINDYPGTANDLSGCVNDANDWREAMEARGFKATSLLDSQATKSAMIKAIQKIVAATGRNDIAVITYSGHGTWIPDEDGDEADGRDEALCPHDISQGKVLTDDELYDVFSNRARGARIIVISDSCHSGTVSRANSFMPGTRGDTWHFPKVRFLAPELYIRKNKTLMKRAIKVEKTRAKSKIRAASLLMAGCRDEEYSYDAWFNGRANGAFTYAALQVLKGMPKTATYQQWYRKIRKILPHTSYPQTPQISGSWSQRNKWRVFVA